MFGRKTKRELEYIKSSLKCTDSTLDRLRMDFYRLEGRIDRLMKYLDLKEVNHGTQIEKGIKRG